MTDSVCRAPEENTADAIRGRLANYGRKSPEKRTEFSDLPTWVRTAAAMKYLLGMNWKDVAERVGKKPSTLDQYKQSPAFREWRAELEAAARDPKTMAELVMKAHSVGVTLEYLSAFQKAIEAGDYKETGVMARDILDRVGVTKKESKKSGVQAIVLNLGTGSLDIPMGDSRVVEVQEGEFEVVERD